MRQQTWRCDWQRRWRHAATPAASTSTWLLAAVTQGLGRARICCPRCWCRPVAVVVAAVVVAAAVGSEMRRCVRCCHNQLQRTGCPGTMCGAYAEQQRLRRRRLLNSSTSAGRLPVLQPPHHVGCTSLTSALTTTAPPLPSLGVPAVHHHHHHQAAATAAVTVVLLLFAQCWQQQQGCLRESCRRCRHRRLLRPMHRSPCRRACTCWTRCSSCLHHVPPLAAGLLRLACQMLLQRHLVALPSRSHALRSLWKHLGRCVCVWGGVQGWVGGGTTPCHAMPQALATPDWHAACHAVYTLPQPHSHTCAHSLAHAHTLTQIH